MFHKTKILFSRVACYSKRNSLVKFSYAIFLAFTAFPPRALGAEGTIGWSYFNETTSGHKQLFAESPMAACSNAAIRSWSGMVGMDPMGDAGTAYHCWLKPRPPSISFGHQIIGHSSTNLVCSSGYLARFPGVCTKILKRAKRVVPPMAPSTPMASIKCSASDPGFTMGNPVILVTGTKVQQEHDIGGNQWGTLEIGRIYRYSRDFVNSPTAGRLWSFIFERQFLVPNTLTGSPPSPISITMGDGSSIIFNRIGSTYQAEGASADTLYPLTPAYDEWAYKSAAGTLEYYKKINSKYLLVSATKNGGSRTDYSYGENGKLNAISDSFGRTLNVTWQDDAAIASISSPEFSVIYHYDQLKTEDGALVSGMQRIANVRISDAEGVSQGVKQYHYGEGWPDWFYLTGVSDENTVRFATYTYDAEGRVSRSEHAGGAQRYDFSYPTDTSRLVVDPLGSARSLTLEAVADQLRVTSFSQPGGAGCGPAASAYAYSPRGLLQSRSDFNNAKTCFTYDPARYLESSRVDGIPAAAACPSASGVLGAGQRKVSSRWHPDWATQIMVAEPLKITHYIYNGQSDNDGSIASCADGGTLPDEKPIAVLCKKIEQATTDLNGGAGFNAIKTGAPRITTHSYNRDGQVLTSTTFGRAGSSGDTTRYEYYADTAASHTRGDLSKITGPTGQVREFLAYTFSGRATKIKEPNGQLIELSYDTRQRLTRRVVTAVGVGEQATSYHYDLVGQLIKVDLPDSSHIAYRYDDAHRLTDITDSLGNTVRYTLDPMGNRVREEVHDSTGKLTVQVVRIYDALNRVQAVTEGAL